MNWLSRWLRPRPHVPAHLADAVKAWQALPPPDRRRPLASARFLVVDTETTGLDPHSAHLLSIGACKVESGALQLAPSFEAAVRPAVPSADENILVHGIGRQRQLDSSSAADALCAFLEFAGRPVFVGFHALFDATVLGRAVQAELGVAFDAAWLDLAVLLPALYPDLAESTWDLDRWLAHFGIPCFSRHGALADACATAELLLLALGRAQLRGARDVHGLYRLQSAELKRQALAHAGNPAG
jgi:DNA polymerase-3 subunit epsilon